MPSTTREEFNTVTQEGPWGSWLNIGNLEFPESGEATCFISTGSSSRTNNLIFALHEGMAAVPDGSTFDSMSLQKSYKKGSADGDAVMNIKGRVKVGTTVRATVWQNSNIAATYASTFSSGDAAFWDLDIYSPQAIITGLKDGSLVHQLWYEDTDGNPDNIYTAFIKQVSLVVNYTEPSAAGGKQGAALISFP